jgi:hypothetical protein
MWHGGEVMDAPAAALFLGAGIRSELILDIAPLREIAELSINPMK